MHDESDLAQARVFYELLSAEAATLSSAIQATATLRGTPRSTTEGRRLERDLREVRRCLDRLRNNFPEVGDQSKAG
ncbi:hypothetical protein F3087_07285 [Nocardia colli]|uniref:Uncharacterized protein n=1 Tax=Nocardia colli TaxID=2545717 RepID=A0A5N0EJF3_9NOCA|nr:hypothetical protein [Nocardia colli]KAA8888809.1 hypothetical protein F3087_07285 [Nocardia colli]